MDMFKASKNYFSSKTLSFVAGTAARSGVNLAGAAMKAEPTGIVDSFSRGATNLGSKLMPSPRQLKAAYSATTLGAKVALKSSVDSVLSPQTQMALRATGFVAKAQISDAVERGGEIARRSGDMLSGRAFHGEGGPITAKTATPQKSRPFQRDIGKSEFHEKLGAMNLDLKELPKLNSVLQGLDSQDLEEEGYESVLALAKAHTPQQLERMAGTLDGFLKSGRGSDEFKEDVVLDGLADVAFPTSIRQGSKNNCGAVTMQQLWAKQKPESYLEALTGMAQGKNHTFPNGQVMTPLLDGLGDQSDDRSRSVKVMGDSLARYAHHRSSVRQGLLNTKKSVLGGFDSALVIPGVDNYHSKFQEAGLHFPSELTTVLGDITGDKYSVQMSKFWPDVQKRTDQNEFVPTLIVGEYGGAMHWVNTTDVKQDKMGVATWGNDYSPSPEQYDEFVKLALIRE